jgi:hypothetical protein
MDADVAQSPAPAIRSTEINTIIEIIPDNGTGIDEAVKEACRMEAMKYSSREDFRVNSPAEYNTARVNSWLDELCLHMPQGEWGNKDACHAEALKYNTRHGFMKGNSVAFNTAKRNYWLDEICLHMPYPSKTVPQGYWNIKENCRLEALKHPTKSQFLKECKNAYNASVRHGWIDDVCVTLIEPRLGLMGLSFNVGVLAHAAWPLGQHRKLPRRGDSICDPQ